MKQQESVTELIGNILQKTSPSTRKTIATSARVKSLASAHTLLKEHVSSLKCSDADKIEIVAVALSELSAFNRFVQFSRAFPSTVEVLATPQKKQSPPRKVQVKKEEAVICCPKYLELGTVKRRKGAPPGLSNTPYVSDPKFKPLLSKLGIPKDFSGIRLIWCSHKGRYVLKKTTLEQATLEEETLIPVRDRAKDEKTTKAEKGEDKDEGEEEEEEEKEADTGKEEDKVEEEEEGEDEEENNKDDEDDEEENEDMEEDTDEVANDDIVEEPAEDDENERDSEEGERNRGSPPSNDIQDGRKKKSSPKKVGSPPRLPYRDDVYDLPSYPTRKRLSRELLSPQKGSSLGSRVAKKTKRGL